MTEKLQIRTCHIDDRGIDNMWAEYPQKTTEPQCSRFLVPYEKDNKFHRDIKGHDPHFLLDKTINPEMVVTEIEFPEDSNEFTLAKERALKIYEEIKEKERIALEEYLELLRREEELDEDSMLET